jgi:hypothetical protein
METTDDNFTEKELRAAFKRSGLWRDGWNYAKAIATDCVRCGLHNTALAIRRKQQHDGKPAPQQQALI